MAVNAGGEIFWTVSLGASLMHLQADVDARRWDHMQTKKGLPCIIIYTDSGIQENTARVQQKQELSLGPANQAALPCM